MIANPNDGNSPRVEVATPTIDVSAGGLITATTEQEKGYVPGGTESATQQLTTQGAKTVTPGTSNQTAVASGRYTTGDVVVSGDANLVPENIAEGVSIFGVTGTHSGGVSIETCTITINATSRFAEIKVYALDADTMDTVYAVAEQRGTASVVLTVVKNSIIPIYTVLDYGTLSITGSYMSIENTNDPTCIEATGDVTISG